MPCILIIYSVMITVLKRTKHKHTLMVEPCSINQQFIMKQIEYIIKDHILIATHTLILLTTGIASFFSLLVA